MPQRFVNTFSPLTPIGAGLQNLTAAMFGGLTPAEKQAKAAQAASYMARAEASQAAAEKARAETGVINYGLDQRKAAPMQFLQGLFGGQQAPAAQANDFLAGKMVEQEGPPEPGQTSVPPMRAPAPEGFTPDLQAKYGSFVRALASGNAGTGKSTAENIQKAYSGYADQDFVDSARTGNMPMPRLIANALVNAGNKGTLPYGGDSNVTRNLYSGDTVTTPVGNSLVSLRGEQEGTEQARQGAYKGQEANSRASAGEHGARTTNLKNEGVMVDFTDPVTKQTYKVPQSELGKIAARGAQTRLTNDEKPTKDALRKPLNKTQSDMLTAAISNLAGGKLEPQTSAALVSRATQLVTDPQGEFFQDPAGAAQAAFSELAPQGLEDTGIPFVPFTGSGMQPKGGLKRSTVGVVGKPAAAPKSAASGLPAAAAAKLKEGVATKFANGQVWTLQGGQPIQVQ